MFGLSVTKNSYETDSDNDDEDYDGDEQEEEYSTRRIQVRHLDMLSKAFSLREPKKYKIERILADKHHVVTMCRAESEPESLQCH